MDKYLKKIIFIIFLIIILITFILVMALLKGTYKENHKKTDNIIDEIEVLENFEEIEKNIKIVNSRNDYYIVKDCLDIYFNNYKKLYNNLKENGEKYLENNKQFMSKLVDLESVQELGLEKNMKLEDLEPFDDNNLIIIKNMYEKKVESNTSFYIVFIENLRKDNSKITSSVIGVKTDRILKTFSIVPSKYFEVKNIHEEKDLEKLEIKNFKSITKNDFNQYIFRSINDEEYIYDLFNNYLNYNRYMINKSWEKLDERYKEKRFKNFDDFREYISKNVKNIAEIKSYKKTRYEDYTQFICIDDYNNIYVFKETSPMNYTVMLDSYTVDLPEFIEKYNNSNEEEKVLINIMKVFEAINHKDYKYVYNKLDQTYRNNNFSKFEEFEKYMNENFFEVNKVSAGNPKKQGDIYMYDIEIRDYKQNGSENDRVIKKTFVMRLDEGTNFTMSFSK